MNRYFKMAVGLIVLLSGWIDPLGAQTVNLTFEEALRMTMQNNHQLKQSDNKRLQMEQEMKAAKGLLMPRITLNATYALMSDNIHLDLTPVRDAIAPLYQTLGNYFPTRRSSDLFMWAARLMRPTGPLKSSLKRPDWNEARRRMS